jgi:hypothetical protein
VTYRQAADLDTTVSWPPSTAEAQRIRKAAAR